jgi:hypothetical protein
MQSRFRRMLLLFADVVPRIFERFFILCPRRKSFELSLHRVITERSLDTVAFLGSSDLYGLRADCRDSDNLAAGDRDDLVEDAAR